MSLLDSVKQFQQQGIGDEQISTSLMEQGYSPKEVNDAISQSKIKAAVENQDVQDTMIQSQSQDMQPSVMEEQPPTPQQETEAYQALQPQQDYSQYQQYQDYAQQPAFSTETITEIAEQVIAEKLSKTKKQIENISEFKAVTESKISSIDERLRRIESVIEKLQMAILEKIGTYGQSMQEIRDEMGTMQESFSKVINPLMDRTRARIKNQEVNEAPEEISPETPEERPKKSKKKPDFEDYLR